MKIWAGEHIFYIWQQTIALNFPIKSSRKLLRIKVTPDLHLTYSKNGGKPGVGTENEKYSLYLNSIDKTRKIYLFIFV